jgi:dolichyl-phosphate beta-glucosyltransferase
MAPTPDVSIVLPAYNSAPFVADAATRVHSFYRGAGIAGELIVVDDGSTDATSDAARSVPGTQVIRLERNRGKGAALRAGMMATRGAACVFTDADLPYGTRSIPLALHYLRESGYHAVVGDRTLPGSSYESVAPTRALLSEFASFTFRTLITGGFYDTQCGFKAFRGDVAREVFRLATIDGFAIDVEILYLLLKYRLDIKRIPVRLERNATSTVRPVRDAGRAARDIVRMRLNWRRGRYASDVLEAVLADDLARDELEASGGERLA